MKNVLRQLFFSFWYLRKPPWDSGITPPEVYEFLNTHPPGWALDLGCGTGTNAVTLAQHGWQVMAIDFAWPAIRVARRKAQRAGLEIDFRVGDVSQDVPLRNKYDLILDIGCLHSLPDHAKERYIRNLPLLLKTEGVFLIYAFVQDSPGNGTGLSAENVALLDSYIELIRRQDGTERGRRPSAWFTFQLCKSDFGVSKHR